VGAHRGIGLHDHQSPERLDVVRQAIDSVFDHNDVDRLLGIAADPTWPPEARLLAAAKLEALHQIAVDERKERPPLDLELVRAVVAGLNSQTWRHPHYFASLLDPGPSPGQQWAKRPEPLP
jgi:hypothetical protein